MVDVQERGELVEAEQVELICALCGREECEIE